MTNHAILHKGDHADLRVITERSAELGDNIMCAQVIPREFREAQLSYPIFFHQHPDSGKFLPYAMFGFEENENLFLQGDTWDGDYLPFVMEKGPFSIGIQRGSGGADEFVISVDLDHPRVSRTQGEPIFLPQGGNSEYIERLSALLHALHEGGAETEAFVGAMLEHDLLESITLEFELDNGSAINFQGFHTISEEKLAALDGDSLEKLSKNNFLSVAYMVVASLSNIRLLIARKNRYSR